MRRAWIVLASVGAAIALGALLWAVSPGFREFIAFFTQSAEERCEAVAVSYAMREDTPGEEAQLREALLECLERFRGTPLEEELGDLAARR